jgi:hypothetical protein
VNIEGANLMTTKSIPKRQNIYEPLNLRQRSTAFHSSFYDQYARTTRNICGSSCGCQLLNQLRLSTNQIDGVLACLDYCLIDCLFVSTAYTTSSNSTAIAPEARTKHSTPAPLSLPSVAPSANLDTEASSLPTS